MSPRWPVGSLPTHQVAAVISWRTLKRFQACFRHRTRTGAELSNDGLAAVGGKYALQRVSAWSSRHRPVLGHEATETRSNEITAIAELIALLDLKGCIVTIQAMDCQRTAVWNDGLSAHRRPMSCTQSPWAFTPRARLAGFLLFFTIRGHVRPFDSCGDRRICGGDSRRYLPRGSSRAGWMIGSRQQTGSRSRPGARDPCVVRAPGPDVI